MASTPIELVCQELVELVSDYLNHTLPPAERVRFDAHLLTCRPCTSYLAQMTATLELAGELDKAAATKDVEQQLVSLFRRWQHQK
jgi:anti-sigma factor RsiW